jgi:nicotinamidase-related amidase
MVPNLANLEDSLLLLVDVQPRMVPVMAGRAAMLDRTIFLARVAKELGVPVITSEHVPHKFGETAPELTGLTGEVIGKAEFSAMQSPEFSARVRAQHKNQIIIAGLETHICVTQTCLDLMSEGFTPWVCADATASRSEDRKQIGLNRLAELGCRIVHSESVVYEWMRTSDHPQFRSVLSIVKESVF